MNTLAQLHSLLHEQQQAIRPQIDARIAELTEEADKLRGQIRDLDSIIKLLEPRTDGLNLDLAIAAIEEFPCSSPLEIRLEEDGCEVILAMPTRTDNVGRYPIPPRARIPSAQSIALACELLKAERGRRKDQA